MRPIYFPFTYVPEPIADALASCFRQIAAYQPSSLKIPDIMHKKSDAGILDIRVPVTGDEEQLDRMIKAYRTWADLHQGAGMAFFKTQGSKIPFFDETSVWQIRSDIRQRPELRPPGPESESPTPLLDARIFLCIAQDFDMQNWELNNDIASFEEMQQDLIRNLKGEDSEFEISNLKSEIRRDDLGHHKTSERIRAWACVMQHDPEPSALFVTSSQSVFEHLIDRSPTAEEVLRFDSIPLCENDDAKKTSWQDSLMEHLDMLAEKAWPISAADAAPEMPAHDECGRRMSLTICLIPGESPDEFFVRCVGHGGLQTGKGDNKRTKYKNTLLGLIGF